MKLCEYTAHELAKKIRSKEVSVLEIVESVYKRIEEKDNEIGAYISLQKENAFIKAKEIQSDFDKGIDMPLLAGIPIAIKDNICTKGITTTCASKMLENFVPPYNATIIDRLAQNRAIIIGKTNMDEFAMGTSTEHSDFRRTCNPYNTECVPGGSSGGSAAAVSAHEAITAIGSDTGGSVRQPASFCGVVGLKPTYGRVSRYGLIAFASSLDQIGPLGKDVEDVAIMLNAISGRDIKDSTSADIPCPDYTKSLDKDVKGLKVGILKEFFEEGINSEVKEAILNQVNILKSLGAEIIEYSVPSIKYALPSYYIISSAEASSNLSRFDGVKYGYRTKEAIGLNELYEKTRSEGFGAEVKRRIILGTYVLSSGYYDAYYNKALKVRTLIRNDFNRVFETCDVIIGPTSPTTAFKIGEKSENPIELYLADVYTVPINIAGVPAISVPIGFDSKKLPIGMQIIGKAFDEDMVLRVANNVQKTIK